ncbi:MAG: FtsX-like permease family protein [Myxococcales bacterium]|nr:FtsX-like permease family protein [Myxococcales bacterium]
MTTLARVTAEGGAGSPLFLIASEWLYGLIAFGALFVLWLVYLLIPRIGRLSTSLLNLLWRRGDVPSLKRVVVVTFAAVGLVLGGAIGFSRLSPEAQYFVTIGAFLLVIITVVLLVVAFITWLTLGLFQLVSGPLLSRNVVLFVGWHFLRAHRAVTPELRTYEGGRRPHGAILAVLVAIFTAGAATVHLLPWSRVLTGPAKTVGAVQIALAVAALLVASFYFRPVRAPGSSDLFDRVDQRLRRLPNLLTVTVTTFVSIVGVGVGVWALIVVLSVMGGFEQDLKGKILSTNPHILIQDQEPMEGIPDVPVLLAELSRLAGVKAALPYVQGEVIVNSRDNRNVAMTLRGIDPRGLAAVDHHLQRSVVSGSIENLVAPERVLPAAEWRLQGGGFLDEPAPESAAPGPAEEPVPDPLAPTEIPTDLLAPTPIPGVDVGPTPASSVRSEPLRPGLVLGRELASSLHVTIGSEVTVVSPKDDAGFLGVQPRARTYRVAAIFATGMYDFDSKQGYVMLAEAQRFFQMGQDINRIELHLTDVDDSDSVVALAKPLVQAASDRLAAQTGTRANLDVLDWKSLNKNLFSALMLERIVMFVVLGFISLVAAFNVVGSLVMIILDKRREIAVLKSLGSPERAVFRMFLVLGGAVGTIGSTSGLLVGMLSLYAISGLGLPLPKQYYIDKLPVFIDPITIGIIYLAGIALCALATIYPALEASSVDPVDGLRNE